jgi:hypothetical protein
MTWRRGELKPVSYDLRPLRSRKDFIREDSGRVRNDGNAWMALDVISIVIRWPAFGDTRNRSIGQLVAGMKLDGSVGSVRKKQTVRRRKGSPEIRRVLDLAGDEWRSMIFFSQRPGVYGVVEFRASRATVSPVRLTFPFGT